MTPINTLVPFTASLISFIFAGFIFKRYIDRRGPYLLLWGIGMVFYGIGWATQAQPSRSPKCTGIRCDAFANSSFFLSPGFYF